MTRNHRKPQATLCLLAALMTASAAPAAGFPPLTNQGATEDAATCSLLVCAAASSQVAVDCTHSVDEYTGVHAVRCTVTSSGAGAGDSPVFLPGRMTGEVRTEMRFTCAPVACSDPDLTQTASFGGTWGGGPVDGPQGLGPGVSAAAGNPRVFSTLTRPTHEHDACMTYEVTTTTTVTARVVEVRGVPVPLDTATTVDVASATGTFCMG